MVQGPTGSTLEEREMNAYEWAIEEYLGYRRQRFWRVKDLSQALLAAGPTKNFDYLVEVGDDRHVLLEVKGRRYPTRHGAQWENWITGKDLAALEAWTKLYKTLPLGLLVFVYRVMEEDVQPDRSWTPITLEPYRFGAVACSLSAYAGACRRRSPKWDTWSVKPREFVRLVRPLADYLPAGEPPSATEALPSEG